MKKFACPHDAWYSCGRTVTVAVYPSARGAARMVACGQAAGIVGGVRESGGRGSRYKPFGNRRSMDGAMLRGYAGQAGVGQNERKA